MGYATFGNLAPGNLLTGFGFYNPYWLLDIANATIVIHLLGAYQVYYQPLFAFIEKSASQKWLESELIAKDIMIRIPGFSPYNLNLLRPVQRIAFVLTITIICMLLPFLNDIVGLLGALGFWPLAVYFPIGILHLHSILKSLTPYTFQLQFITSKIELKRNQNRTKHKQNQT
ncbi:Amino acid permease 3 [Bienertia sinuspersici]